MPVQESDRTRSLKSLFLESDIQDATAESVAMIPLDSIIPNRNQPRSEFNEKTIQELAESIQSKGILQPVIVRRLQEDGATKYELVAGERRFRAFRFLKRVAIPAIIRNYKDEEIRVIALMENIQREDLPVLDKAKAIKRLLTELKTISEVTKALGISERSVQNYLRISEMPESFQSLVLKNEMNFRTIGKMAALASKVMKEPEEKQEKITSKVQEILSDSPATTETVESLEKRFFGPREETRPRPLHTSTQLRRGDGFKQLGSKFILSLEFKKDESPTKEDLEFFDKQMERFLGAVKHKDKK